LTRDGDWYYQVRDTDALIGWGTYLCIEFQRYLRWCGNTGEMGYGAETAA